MLLTALLGLAPVQAPTPLARADAWTVTAQAGHCSLQRDGRTGERSLSIRQYLEKPWAEIWIGGGETTAYSSRLATIVLRPSATSYAATAWAWTGEGGVPVIQLMVEQDLIEQLGAADTLDLRVADGPVISVSVGHPDASSQLRTCRATLLRSLGVDPARFRPALRPGQSGFVDQAPLITAQDYPVAALRAGAQGRVGTLVALDERGAVSSCRVLESSANADLDARTCEIAQARLSYPPIRDAAGRPAPGWTTFSLRWTLPH